MALDGIFLRYIKHEIETEALGARVSQIYQPNRDELVFAMRTFNGNKKLAFCKGKFSESAFLQSHSRKPTVAANVLYAFTQANRRRQARSGSSAGVRQSAFSRL